MPDRPGSDRGEAGAVGREEPEGPGRAGALCGLAMLANAMIEQGTGGGVGEPPKIMMKGSLKMNSPTPQEKRSKYINIATAESDVRAVDKILEKLPFQTSRSKFGCASVRLTLRMLKEGTLSIETLSSAFSDGPVRM